MTKLFADVTMATLVTKVTNVSAVTVVTCNIMAPLITKVGTDSAIAVFALFATAPVTAVLIPFQYFSSFAKATDNSSLLWLRERARSVALGGRLLSSCFLNCKDCV